jgi:dihydrolipoamide dehydrogenase
MKYDLIVIGGGPAGYVGAIRAAQLGARVACVELERAGGTCLNWGCIPTKSLLRNAELFSTLQHDAESFGIKLEGLSYDWSAVIGRSRKVADRLAGGIEFLFKKNKVDYIVGRASIPEPGKVRVVDAEGTETEHEADNILVSTGVQTRDFPHLPIDGTKIIGSRQALVLEEQPKEIVIIGAGAIGVEFAYFFNAFGTKVTIVEMMPRLLPVEDEEISAELGKSFKKQGIRVLTGSKVSAADTAGKRVRLTVEGDTNEEIEADLCLLAVGVTPLLPDGVEFELDRGYLVTDARYQTSVPGVFAAGDIIGPPWLAHVASFEAMQCVEGLFLDGHTPKKVGTFPGCTYCNPQVASVGLTEQAAKEQGLAYRVGKFPFQASGKAQAAGETEGFVKLLFGEEHGELIGAHIIGHGATELIAELGLAIELEATYEEINQTIHAHPTLSEAVMEASHAAFGHAIHC